MKYVIVVMFWHGMWYSANFKSPEYNTEQICEQRAIRIEFALTKDHFMGGAPLRVICRARKVP